MRTTGSIVCATSPRGSARTRYAGTEKLSENCEESWRSQKQCMCPPKPNQLATTWRGEPTNCTRRSEEHTSELQSQSNLVCRLLLEKKKQRIRTRTHY